MWAPEWTASNGSHHEQAVLSWVLFMGNRAEVESEQTMEEDYTVKDLGCWSMPSQLLKRKGENEFRLNHIKSPIFDVFWPVKRAISYGLI